MSHDSPTSAVADLEGVGTVLVLAPRMATDREALCAALLERGDASRAVGVTYQGSAAGWVDRHAEAFARGTVAIEVGGAPGVSGDGRVDSPDDLTGLEIAVNEAVAGEPVAFCLDSLTTLLQYVDEDRAFRFVHALVTRLAEAGASAHLHLDPGTVDDRTLRVIRSFVDAVVELGDEGGVTVRRRPTAGE